MINSHINADPSSSESGNVDKKHKENSITLIKAELLAFNLYSLYQNMKRIRTRFNQSKFLEKNEKLRDERLSKVLIIRMPSKSLSQITYSSNIFNSMTSVGSRTNEV